MRCSGEQQPHAELLLGGSVSWQRVAARGVKGGLPTATLRTKKMKFALMAGLMARAMSMRRRRRGAAALQGTPGAQEGR
jgi:hypothetical protein